MRQSARESPPAFEEIRFRDRLPRKRLLHFLVAPIAERAFGELHDVAFVHERQRPAIVLDRVLAAMRTNRREPNSDIGLMPIAEFSRICLPELRLDDLAQLVRSGEPAFHSIPA